MAIHDGTLGVQDGCISFSQGSAQSYSNASAPQGHYTSAQRFARQVSRNRVEATWQCPTTNEPELSMEPFDLRGGTFGRHYRQKGQEHNEGEEENEQ